MFSIWTDIQEIDGKLEMSDNNVEVVNIPAPEYFPYNFEPKNRSH